MMNLSTVNFPKSRTVTGAGDDDVVEIKPFNTAATTINRRSFTAAGPNSSTAVTAVTAVTDAKYGACLRNHAASIGGHANDGCGEFLPSAPAEHSFVCAACGCHRNFHRRDPPLSGGDQQPLSPRPHPPPPPPQPVMFYGSPNRFHRNASGGGGGGSEEMYDRRSATPERAELVPSSATATGERKKRFRTRFTIQQKDRMLEFSERSGWRIPRRDDIALIRFCNEVGVKRKILKVWMHNNKNTYRRRDRSPAPRPSQSPSVIR